MKFFVKTLCVIGCLIISPFELVFAENSSPPKILTDSRVTQDKSDNTNDQMGNSIIETIRSAIAKDQSVSTYAQSIIIVPEGHVLVLRGAVVSSFEKLSIEKAAYDAAGQDNIRSELLVVK